MHTTTQKNDVSLAKELQQHLFKQHSQKWFHWSDQIQKRASIGKYIDIEYHVQYNTDVTHKYVKIYCNTNQLPALPFCGPNSKPHGVRGLSKHHHLCFNPKLGYGVCTMCCIPCACVACT